MQGRPPCLDIELQRRCAGSMALIELYSHEYTSAPCLKVQLGETLQNIMKALANSVHIICLYSYNIITNNVRTSLWQS